MMESNERMLFARRKAQGIVTNEMPLPPANDGDMQ